MIYFEPIYKGEIDTNSLPLWWKTFTSAYNDMNVDVKELYMQNCFDGQLSTVFYLNSQMVGFVLVENETALSENIPNSRSICKIVGYSCVDSLVIEMFRYLFFKLSLISALKPTKRFKGKYSHVIIQYSNEQQEKICRDLGMVKATTPNTYILKFR